MSKIIICFYIFICLVSCVSTDRSSGSTEPIQLYYIEPQSIEAAQYGIEERMVTLESQLRNSRDDNARARQEIDSIRAELEQSREYNARARQEISLLRESYSTIIMASGRSIDLIQETIEYAERLDNWVNWAVDRLSYLEELLAAYLQ